jgi:K319L-like, PKD domain
MRSRSSRGCLFSLTLALVGISMPAWAQPTAPIYLQYDGFVRNSDGSRTLAFGYFNMNHVDVTIPAGPDNQFTPGPADRQQPLTFLEGRHRFACVMVVPADFDGNLMWEVKYAGKTNKTTTKLLDPLYQLELNSQRTVMAGLDVDSAPKLTCANKSPIVALRSGFNPQTAALAGLGLGLSGGSDGPPPEPTLKAKAGAPLNLNGAVSDDHMPRGSSVTSAWKKLSGPGEVTFADASKPRTTATFSAAGDYEIELDATDGAATGSTKAKVTVSPAS